MIPSQVNQNRLFRNIAANYAGKIIALGIGFMLTPFILGQLGPASFGLWVLTSSLVAYGGLLDLGIAGATIKYVAEYRRRGDSAQLQSIIATTLCLYTLIGAFTVCISFLIAPILPRMFQIPHEQQAIAGQLVLLLGTSLGIGIPASTTSAVLRGLQRFDIVNGLNTAGIVVSAVATVTVLASGEGVVAMTALTIPITLIMQIPTLWCIRRVAPELTIGWRGAAFKYVRMVLGFSSGVFLIQAVGQLQTKTDEIVIGSYLPITFVTPYNIARRLSEIPQILTDQFIKVLLPLASDMHAADEQERITNLYLASSRLTLAMFLPLACTLAILAAQIITFWVGATYASYAPLVLVLVLASLVDTSTWPAGHVLQGMARHHPVAVISICSGVVNLVLSILLVPQLGVMGVALGTLIPTCIECVGFVIPYTLRVLQINPRTWILTVVWPVVVPTIATSIVVYLFQTIWYPLSLFGIIGTASLGVFVFIGLYIQLNRAAPEVELLRHKFEQTWQDRFVCFQR